MNKDPHFGHIAILAISVAAVGVGVTEAAKALFLRLTHFKHKGNQR